MGAVTVAASYTAAERRCFILAVAEGLDGRCDSSSCGLATAGLQLAVAEGLDGRCD